MTRTACHICGADADAFICKPDGNTLRRALRNPNPGDPDIPTLLAALSQAATGQAHVYRAMRRPGEPDQELAELEHEHAAHDAAIGPMLRSRDGRITLPTSRTVANLAARDLLDEAWNELATTARALLEHRQLDNPFTPDAKPRHVADWLADNIDAIRYDPAAADVHHAITSLRERLLRAVDRAPSRVYAGPCDALLDPSGARCEQPLYASFNPWRVNTADDPDDTYADDRLIVCDGYRPPNDPQWDSRTEGCGTEHTVTDRQKWLIASLDDRLESVAYWAHWLPLILAGRIGYEVPRGVILSWAKPIAKGGARLMPRSIDRDAVELFRGGDVMDLMGQYRPKRYAPRPNRGRMSA